MQTQQIDLTYLVEAMLNEAYAQGGFDYETQVNDKLKSAGLADKNSTTAGSSGDAPDAKFKHNGEEHNLEVKKDHKAMFGQIELKHDGKKWGISDRSRAKYPETAKSIESTGFLHKVNKQWDKPTGDYESDLQKGNVYHVHPDAEPIKSHYGKDRKTPYIQIGSGHGFYHTGDDKAKLGSPELEGKTQLRARMKARGRDADGKRTYGALIVMSLKDAKKSHHDLDAPVQKEWIEDVLNGHKEFVTESRNQADKYWDEAEEHKAEAKKHKVGTEAHHYHMSNHYDAMHRYHSDLGQHREAEKSADKSEDHHEKSLQASGKGLAEGSFKYHVDKAAAAHDRGDTKKKEYHLSNAKTARYSMKTTDYTKNKDLFDKYKQLSEAHKIGDKVQIIKGSDKGIIGKIGEIRHGAYKGAPKTFTVYHGEKDATQVKKEHIKGLKEQAEDITEETECFSKGFWSGQQEEPKVNPHPEGSSEYAEYENGFMQGVMTRRLMQVESDESWAKAKEKEKEQRLTSKDQDTLTKLRTMMAKEKKPVKESHMEFRIDHRDKLTGDHKATFAAHDAKVSDTTDKATYVKVPSHKADSFKSAMKDHGAKVELAEGRDYDDNRRGFGRREREDDEYHVPDPEVKKNKVKKEEVAANNVGDGSIAGTQGDAGKKVVMTKQPLKRKTLAQFKSYVSQEHDYE